MKLNKHINIYFINPLLFVSLFYMIYAVNAHYFLDEYEPKKLTVDVELKVQEDDMFQLFYRDSISKHNEKFSQQIQVVGSEQFQWIRFSVPDSNTVSHIRFDIGNKYNQSQVEIRKFYVRYNGHLIDLTKDSISTYFETNRFIQKVSNTVFKRKVIDNRSDPILSSINLGPIINQLKQKKNYSRIILNLILSLLLALAGVIAIKQNMVTYDMFWGRHQFFVGIFLLLITLPFFDIIFSLDNTNINEKRKLALKPELTYENINDYPNAYETYFNDHFGFRGKLISYGGIIKAKLFNTSPREDDVIMGNDDWLFYWRSGIRSSYKNENPFTKSGLETFATMINNTNEWATSNNKLFLATIYPNKHSVYEEHLPVRIRNLKKDTTDRTDVTFKFFKENGIVNVEHLENFRIHKNENQIYFKHDTHWNSFGAYLAYKSIINELRSFDNEIMAPLQEKDFIIKINDEFANGDLLDFMGIDNAYKLFKENAPLLSPKEEHDLIKKNDYFGKQTVLIENRTIESDKVVLLVGDSFNNELIKLLPLNFKKTYFSRSVRLNNKIIEKIMPDVIIYGIVERNLENFK